MADIQESVCTIRIESQCVYIIRVGWGRCFNIHENTNTGGLSSGCVARDG